MKVVKILIVVTLLAFLWFKLVNYKSNNSSSEEVKESPSYPVLPDNDPINVTPNQPSDEYDYPDDSCPDNSCPVPRPYNPYPR